MPKRIEEEWAGFKRMVMPPGAGRIQVEEMRRSFYAGASALLALLQRKLDPGSDPTAADLAMLDEIDRELQQHFDDLLRS